VAYLEPLASWVCRPVRRTGGCAPREGIKRNRGGSAPLTSRCGAWPLQKLHLGFEAGVSPQTANLGMILFSSSVGVKDNPSSLLGKRGSWSDQSAYLRSGLSRLRAPASITPSSVKERRIAVIPHMKPMQVQLAGTPRKIVDYHLDECFDWVADLECGHQQHVRRNPMS
jgi:hypothetical protein